MTQQLIATQTCAGAFETVAQADRAVRQLLATGFAKEQLAVVCPARFKDHFPPEAPQAKAPAAHAEGAIAVGGAVGATLGGLAMAATAITGGVAGVLAGVVLVGGGAIAGAFSNLIVAKGYEQETDDRCKQAIEQGQIVVGVEVHGEDGAGRIARARQILEAAGARLLLPK